MNGRVNPLNRILVPLDGSFLAEQALPYAKALAGDGEITLVAVTSLPEAVKDLAGHVVATVDEIVARTGRRRSPDSNVRLARGSATRGAFNSRSSRAIRPRRFFAWRNRRRPMRS